MKRTPFVKINIFLVLGVCSTIVTYISYKYLPLFLEDAIFQKLVLNPQSSTYKGWQKTNIPIYSNYYLFNVTNANELLKGDGVKPILQEVGPYTFQQVLEKVNITWNYDNGTVEYRQVKRWFLLPQLNNRSLDDEIIHINVPLISAIYHIESSPLEEQYIAYESLNSLAETFNLTFFKKTKVRDLLFDGYDDVLLETAQSFYPNQNIQSKFGWLYSRNNSASDGLFRVFTGQKNFGHKFGLIDTWNLEKSNVKWKKGFKCRSFEGTTGGDFMPPFTLLKDKHLLNYFENDDDSKQPKTLRIFLADMCRAFDLEFKEPITYKGTEGYRYHIGPKLFNYSFEENRCFCDKSCPPNGLYSLNTCAKGSPIFISSPHFLNSDPILKEDVIGLQPSESKHEFYMDYDKKMAITMNVRARFQINLLVEKSDKIEIMSDWPDDVRLYLPQFWFETSVGVSQMITEQINFLTNILPLIILGITICLALLTLAIYAFVLIYVILNCAIFTQQIPKYESVSMLESKVESVNG